MPANPIIFKARTVAMQRIMDAICHGHIYWCSGTITIQRCAKLVSKFDINYQVLADRNAKARRKRAGLGNANLVLWLNDDVIRWWLLVTPPESGDHAAHSTEKLRNALDRAGRIEIDGFELVSLPKPSGQPKNGKSQATERLTWRMSQRKYEDWRIAIIDAVRGASPHALHNLVYRLWSSPGFGGVRSQIGKLAALYNAEVKRVSRKDAPALPKRLSYVRRLDHCGVSLLQLVAQQKASQ